MRFRLIRPSSSAVLMFLITVSTLFIAPLMLLHSSGTTTPHRPAEPGTTSRNGLTYSSRELIALRPSIDKLSLLHRKSREDRSTSRTEVESCSSGGQHIAWLICDGRTYINGEATCSVFDSPLVTVGWASPTAGNDWNVSCDNCSRRTDGWVGTKVHGKFNKVCENNLMFLFMFTSVNINKNIGLF